MPDAACREALIALMPRAVFPVLLALAKSDSDLCAAALSRKTGLPPATVRYALRKLLAAGCVGRPYGNAGDVRLRYYHTTDRGCRSSLFSAAVMTVRYKGSCAACGYVEYSEADASPLPDKCLCGMPRRVIVLTEGEYRTEVARFPGEILTDHIYARSQRVGKRMAKERAKSGGDTA